MNVWAIADLHLAFGVPQKSMDVFGDTWVGYADKIEKNWRATIDRDDLVLIAGDISWATSLQEAKVDLDWIDTLPGTKVMVKGNHDYWWSSLAKVGKILPPSIHLIQNNVFIFDNIAIAGARLWDTDEYSFNAYIDFKSSSVKSKKEIFDQEKIFKRELERLAMSLKEIPAGYTLRFAMTHYPPIGGDLKQSLASALLEKYQISHCVFGHLHNVKKDLPLFGSARGVTYSLTSCDYLDFYPYKIYSSAK